MIQISEIYSKIASNPLAHCWVEAINKMVDPKVMGPISGAFFNLLAIQQTKARAIKSAIESSRNS